MSVRQNFHDIANRLAMTLTVYLEDEVTGIGLELLYTIFEVGAVARSARIINRGEGAVHILSAMSLCKKLPL